MHDEQAGSSIAGCILHLSLILLAGCGSKKIAGITKDFNTGLTAQYSNMQPKSVFLVNNEVLGHTDIPLGE